ncbi:MAG TPA: PQQ-dependent sugar dehydrogenase, partial [Tepidisphaeraceae bacterium]|nr:PQQ-dependent sugar dehydrogenase [Tepidisphaeraceae bacterium]
MSHPSSQTSPFEFRISSLFRIPSFGFRIFLIFLLPSLSLADLPTAPPGFTLRELAPFDTNLVRLAAAPDHKSLYAMSTSGDVWQVDLATGAKTSIFTGSSYAGGGSVLGLAATPDNRLYIVSNIPDASVEPNLNRVIIFRTSSFSGGPQGRAPLPADPKPWFQTTYPYGVDTFNHGVSKIALGPDGFLYVSSGSRTDHGEARHQEHHSTEGEVPLTGCLWRLDPAAEHPQVEIFAAGIRNAFGFCFDDHNQLFATENGPNADAPEELNLLQPNHHYGFPYRFSTMTTSLYADQPSLPLNLKIDLPILNDGPAGGATLSTFEP